MWWSQSTPMAEKGLIDQSKFRFRYPYLRNFYFLGCIGQISSTYQRKYQTCSQEKVQRSSSSHVFTIPESTNFFHEIFFG